MPLRDDLLTPISAESPGGSNLRYDPVRDAIKEARREEMEAPQGAWKTEVKVANWGQVIKLAGDTLAKRSKDLQLGVWLVDAQVRKEGFASLTPGFRFIEGLLEQFWDHLYPEIDEGDLEERAAPLEWLGTKLEEPIRVLPVVSGGLSWVSYKQSLLVGTESEATSQELQKKRTQALSEGRVSGEQWAEAVKATPKATCEKLQETVREAIEALDQLSATSDRFFGRDGPSFSRTHTALEDIAALLRVVVFEKGGPTPVAAPVEAPVPVVAEVAATPSVSTAPVAAAPPVAAPTPPPAAAAPVVTSAGIDPTDLADAERRLVAICRFYRNTDVYDIAPFLILRGLRFGQIRYNGPHQIAPSMLEPPPSELRAEMKRLAAEQKWDDLLIATERAMSLPCGRAWLDIQRYTVLALEGKGQWWAFVADAVRAEVRGLLTDLPKLLDMTLLDDTPTANGETRKWIEESILSGMPPVAAAPPPPPMPAPVAYVPPPVESTELPTLDSRTLETQDEAFEKAIAAANSGQLSDALTTLSEQLSTERSGRGRFHRRLQIAHILVRAGQTEVALPLLQDLAEEVSSRGLDTWEEARSLGYPLSLLLSCLQSNDSSNGDKSAIYARICKLDPARALTLPRL